MPLLIEDFPFDELRQPSGDYFDTAAQAIKAGHTLDHIWSVTLSEDEDDSGDTFTYGPAYHCINVIGFIATNEQHDGDTYYEEVTS